TLRICRGLVEDADVARVAAALEANDTVDLGEERVVGAAADVEAGLEPRAALADEDAAAADELSSEPLDAEHLRIGVAAVAGAADTFLVRHLSIPRCSGCGPTSRPAGDRGAGDSSCAA